MFANRVTLAVIVLVAGVLLIAAPAVHWTPVKIFGAAVAAVGWVLLVVARVQLGASFSVRAKARKLVTTGIYAKVRNPIYVFSAMFLAGLVVVSGLWILLLPLALVVPLQMRRARNEERVLAEAFGEEYERYKAGTWF